MLIRGNDCEARAVNVEGIKWIHFQAVPQLQLKNNETWSWDDDDDYRCLSRDKPAHDPIQGSDPHTRTVTARIHTASHPGLVARPQHGNCVLFYIRKSKPHQAPVSTQHRSE